MRDKKVSVSKMENKEKGYPQKPPFYPPVIYPELRNLNIQMETNENNQVYEAVRNAFIFMGLDADNVMLENWNPLSEIIKPGECVVIKPNFVFDWNINDRTSQSVITHGSVIRVVIDYVILALHGRGRIVIADAPQMNCDFEKLIRKNGMKAVIGYYSKQLKGSGIDIELMDLRRERTIYKYGVVWKRIPLKGDPLGYTEMDLKNDSELSGLNPKKFYGADYNRKETISAHSDGHHKYFISNTILNSDLIISIPKLKVHRKVGVTLNIKNMVGINGNKNYLVHYQIGTQSQGGDEFSIESRQAVLDRTLKDMTMGKSWRYGKYLYAVYLKGKELFKIKDKNGQNVGGDWWGNDTAWRMAIDLNNLLLYSSKGSMTKGKTRRYLSVIDGIVGGEGEGPLAPTPVKSGMIIAGTNPMATDIVATLYMGLDYKKIKFLELKTKNQKRLMDFSADEIEIVDNAQREIKGVKDIQKVYKYKVPLGWKNYL
ncbi:DUF362 domain-containing protein [Clostridiaceae bacterium]|nr:DUF362 domain-containing protein [Clostridiaceae bacterium]RKI16907.1 DUF362 domain-containing protein [bacterium 1XD21-70]